MMEIRFEIVDDTQEEKLEEVLESVLGNKYLGKSRDSQGLRVILTDDSSLQTQALTENVILGHNSLSLDVTQETIDANNIDTSVISWDGENGVDSFLVTAYLNGEVYKQVTDNSAPFQVTFRTDIAGSYTIKVEKVGTYETGFIIVEAT